MIIQISSAASMPLDPTVRVAASSRAPRDVHITTQRLAERARRPSSISHNTPAKAKKAYSAQQPSPAHQADSPTITLGASFFDSGESEGT